VGTVAAMPAPPSFIRRGDGPDPLVRRQLALASPTLLAVGRLVPIKGHDRLLHACARARATDLSRIDPEVVILGDGPERARLAALAARLGVRLRLPGFVPRAEVGRWLAAADLYVQPSVRLATGRSEGAPLATAEARSVGIPVIVESDPARLAAAIQAVAGPGVSARKPIVTGV
jgi:glycosyltransferase involved in cell wall biosynthesis